MREVKVEKQEDLSSASFSSRVREGGNRITPETESIPVGGTAGAFDEVTQSFEETTRDWEVEAGGIGSDRIG